MHDHGNRDSLVYWLEFKDDEEFPAIFGSIAGGSALKCWALDHLLLDQDAIPTLVEVKRSSDTRIRKAGEDRR